MQHSTRQRNTTDHNAAQRNGTQYNTTQCNATQQIQHNSVTTDHNAMQQNRHNTMDCSTTQHNTVDTTQQNSPQHDKTGNKNRALTYANQTSRGNVEHDHKLHRKKRSNKSGGIIFITNVSLLFRWTSGKCVEETLSTLLFSSLKKELMRLRKSK